MVQLFYPEKSEFSLAAADYFCPLGLEILILRLRWEHLKLQILVKFPSLSWFFTWWRLVATPNFFLYMFLALK